MVELSILELLWVWIGCWSTRVWMGVLEHPKHHPVYAPVTYRRRWVQIRTTNYNDYTVKNMNNRFRIIKARIYSQLASIPGRRVKCMERQMGHNSKHCIFKSMFHHPCASFDQGCKIWSGHWSFIWFSIILLQFWSCKFEVTIDLSQPCKVWSDHWSLICKIDKYSWKSSTEQSYREVDHVVISRVLSTSWFPSPRAS